MAAAAWEEHVVNALLCIVGVWILMTLQKIKSEMATRADLAATRADLTATRVEMATRAERTEMKLEQFRESVGTREFNGASASLNPAVVESVSNFYATRYS